MALIRSGIRVKEGLQFTELSFHDSIWHIYLIDELKQNFLPRHAGFAPALVKNYHFLLDLTIASFTKYLPLSTFEMYYRIIPVFVSLLLSLGVFVFARRFNRCEKTANIAVVLTLFSGNASWFFSLFRGDEFQIGSNTFMLDSITFMLHNPHAVIVFPLMLAGIIGLQLLIERRSNMLLTICTAIIFGVLIGFKAWGGTLVLISLPIIAFWISATKKRHDFWLIWFMTIALSLLIFLPVYDSDTAAQPIFLPFWLLKRMVEDPDRYNMPKYFLLEQHYRETNNILRLIQINFTQILIYLFGNLWIRILGFFALLNYLRKKVTPNLLFIILIILASLGLPILFNQGRMSYEIIQFGPYSLVLLSIFTAPVIMKIASRFKAPIKSFVLISLLALSISSNFKTLSFWLNAKKIIITNSELEANEFLLTNSNPSSVILLFPSKVNLNTAKIAALSHRTTYLSARTFNIITGEDYYSRELLVNQFFKKMNPEQRNYFLKENSIDYIYLSDTRKYTFYPQGLGLNNVFSNDKVTIYKVN